MKTRYIILLGIIGTAALYIYQDEALQTRLLGKVHQIAPELNQTTLYKWKNDNGEWQITDKPPGKGITFTTTTIQHQVNVMPSPDKKKRK